MFPIFYVSYKYSYILRHISRGVKVTYELPVFHVSLTIVFGDPFLLQKGFSDETLVIPVIHGYFLQCIDVIFVVNIANIFLRVLRG